MRLRSCKALGADTGKTRRGMRPCPTTTSWDRGVPTRILQTSNPSWELPTLMYTSLLQLLVEELDCCGGKEAGAHTQLQAQEPGARRWYEQPVPHGLVNRRHHPKYQNYTQFDSKVKSTPHGVPESGKVRWCRGTAGGGWFGDLGDTLPCLSDDCCDEISWCVCEAYPSNDPHMTLNHPIPPLLLRLQPATFASEQFNIFC